MTVIRAHFDGRNIIPDEPVDLAVGQELEIVVKETRNDAIAERRDAFRRFADRPIPGISIPGEALRRENMYEDRL